MSARTRRRRRPRPPRRRGAAPATPSWRARSAPPSGPSWHSRSTCSRSPPPAGMQRRSVSPCPRRYSRPQCTRNVPPFGAPAGPTMGTPNLSTSWPSAAAAPRTIGPKSVSTARPGQLRRQGPDERRRQKEVVGRDRWRWGRRGAGPQRQLRTSQRDEHTSTRGKSAPHPAGRVEGIASPSWVLANVAAAARRVAAHVARTAASIDGTGTAPFRPERSAVSTSSSQRALAGGAAAGVALGP